LFASNTKTKKSPVASACTACASAAGAGAGAGAAGAGTAGTGSDCSGGVVNDSISDCISDSINVRVAEFHTVLPGGGLADPSHYDWGSLLTLGEWAPSVASADSALDLHTMFDLL
jgi:hypothetical protein